MKLADILHSLSYIYSTTLRTMHTTYQSIAAQAANSLREEIHSMAPGETLPGERQLSLRLQVSRKTVRKALMILRAEGLVATRSSSATSVVSIGRSKSSRRTIRVHLMLPDSLEEARPFTVLWVNQLASLLNEAGHKFEVIFGRKYYGERVGRLLSKLVESNPADCWILARSNYALQNWFSKNKIPTVIAGSSFSGITLPSVDADHQALGRHAAAEFIRHEHLHTALFLDQESHAGDSETVDGFKEVLARHPNAASPLVSKIPRSPDAVVKEIRRHRALSNPPTGYLISNCFCYLTTQSYLGSLGLRIPQDISLISQDEGPFLTHIYPTPARYLTNPRKYALALNRTIKHVLEKDTKPDYKVRIMLDYLPGNSVARRTSV